jgi:ParB/RepB/Spo0J family partition protein
MVEHSEVTETPLARLGTTLARARCSLPTQVERIKQSLSSHGQLTPVVVVERSGTLEIIDGFKRRAAASAMGWSTLRASTVRTDQTGQWGLMLALNRGPQSMSELEEALVLRELVATGMKQREIGELLHRHKSWVSRRIGLLERLHPELVEALRLGLLRPGVARRLMALPAGNQLEMAAVAQQYQLGPHETEQWVRLWRQAKSPEIRRYVLQHPREALAHADPTAVATAALDPRLSPEGQRLLKLLRIAQGIVPRARSLLPPTTKDRPMLIRELRASLQAVGDLAAELSSAASEHVDDATGASDATS